MLLAIPISFSYDCIMRPVSWMKWADFVTRAKHVTIADVEYMQEGAAARVLFLDRNFGDHVYNLARKKMAERGRPNCRRVTIDVRELLEMAYVGEYTHVRGLSGMLKWEGDWAEGRDPEEFEWDLEYNEHGSFYKLHHGKLPRDFGQYDHDRPYGAEGRPWESFPKDRRVGWRGPCLFVKDLEELPKKMYYEDLDLGSLG